MVLAYSNQTLIPNADVCKHYMVNRLETIVNYFCIQMLKFGSDVLVERDKSSLFTEGVHLSSEGQSRHVIISTQLVTLLLPFH